MKEKIKSYIEEQKNKKLASVSVFKKRRVF